jgi:hypothetical protein
MHSLLQTYYQYLHVMHALFFNTNLAFKTVVEGASILSFFLLTVILHVIACEKYVEESKKLCVLSRMRQFGGELLGSFKAQ